MTEHPAISRLRLDAAKTGARFIFDTQCTHFRAAMLGEALELWRHMAGSRLGPMRRDMTPQVMRKFVKKVAVIERMCEPDVSSRYRARITGQEFSIAYTDMTGKFIDEVVPAKFLNRWVLVLDAVLASQAPLRGLIVPEAFDRGHSVLEMFLAPLLDDDGVPNSVLFVGNFERGRTWDEVCAEEQKNP